MSDDQPKPGPTFEVPDLELAPVVSKRSPVVPRKPVEAPRQSSSGPTSGRELDLEAGPGVTLASSGGLALGSYGSAFPGGDEDDADDGFQLIQTGSSVDVAGADPSWVDRTQRTEAAWPSGRTRSAEQLPVDAVEVALTAGYGPAPESALLTPVYAYRVFTRQRVVRGLVKALHQQLAQAEAERDGSLAELATRLRPSLEASDTFRRLLEPIREVERMAGDRSQALSEADAGYRERMSKFEQALGSLREAEALAKVRVSSERALVDAAESEFRRAEAKHKRTQIEIRGVMDVARQAVGPAGGEMPQAQAEKLAELQAKAAALEPDVVRTKSALDAANQELQKAEGEVRRVQGDMKKVEREKAGVGGSLEKQLSVRVAGVSEAEQQKREALAEVARAVLASRGAVPVPDDVLAALTSQDQRVEKLAVRLETHVRALDAHDRDRAKLGVSLALGALGLVVLAILLKAVL